MEQKDIKETKERNEKAEPLFFEDLEDLLKEDGKVEAVLAGEEQPALDEKTGAAAPAEAERSVSGMEGTAVPEETTASEEAADPAEMALSEETADPAEKALPEETAVPGEAAASAEVLAAMAMAVPQEVTVSEEAAVPQEAAVPEEAAVPQDASEPAEHSGEETGMKATDENGRGTRFVTAAEIAEKRGRKTVSSGRPEPIGNSPRVQPGHGDAPAEAQASSGEPPVETPPKARNRKKIWKRVLIAAALLLILAAAGAYGYGVRYYSEHFLPGTVAEGVALEELTVQEAEEKLTASRIAEDSSMELLTKDGKTVLLDVTPLGIRRHYLGVRQALEAQNKWQFFLNREEPKQLSFDYEISYDREKTEETLKTLAICDPEKTDAPVNAMLYKEDGTGIWKVLPAYDGDQIDTAVLAEAVAAAVDRREKTVDIADTGAYLKAEIREEDPTLLRSAEVENAIDAASFTVDLGADTIYTVTPDEFRSLLREEAISGEDTESLLDETAFARYLDRLSRNYSTKSGSGYRYFHSITGAKPVVQVEYGWDMNEEETGTALHTMLEEAARKILTGEDVQETYPEHSITAVWDQTAVSHGERDTGSSWVEVDITNQVMYCVIDNEIVLTSDVVTGLDNASRRTPTGIYAIRFKSTDRDLVGYNRDGTEAYRSHVHYWMPFNKNIGLHDATWRYAFGGTIYKRSGSHGCVNLPLKTAKALYGYVYKDMPVIVYK